MGNEPSFEEIREVINSITELETKMDVFLDSEEVCKLREEVAVLLQFNKDNLTKVNQMMLELKGIVAMARGAIQEAHNVCVVRNTQKNTENSQLRKLLREVGKILGKEG